MKHTTFTYSASVPASNTKTKRDYLWLLPSSHDDIAARILGLGDSGFRTADELKRSLKAFYRDQVLKKAEVPVHHNERRLYDMRSIRAYHATEWVKLVTEYRLMNWKPEPLNPLQHETERMTKEHYAAKGSDRIVEAQ